MPSHVYFDFFGTLVDYDPSIHPAGYNAPFEFARRAGAGVNARDCDRLWDRAWAELDGRPSTANVNAQCSRSPPATGSCSAPGIAEGEISRLVEEYLQAGARGSSRAAVGECLAQLSTAGHHLAVVSNTHHRPLVPRLLARFGLDEHISDVFTSIELGWRKPNARIFQAALDRHGITPAEAAFVGDNWVADIEGPRRLGMAAFYVGP
ncbi:HAD family hydrolase, partial [Arthrobacter sp. JCM 19049]|uniref:HAD family hydrolase n=1 Tax=Arthrobacter sp. JCM 19049 TaxID=1460643 RepID=UPI0006D1CC34